MPGQHIAWNAQHILMSNIFFWQQVHERWDLLQSVATAFDIRSNQEREWRLQMRSIRLQFVCRCWNKCHPYRCDVILIIGVFNGSCPGFCDVVSSVYIHVHAHDHMPCIMLLCVCVRVCVCACSGLFVRRNIHPHPSTSIPETTTTNFRLAPA